MLYSIYQMFNKLFCCILFFGEIQFSCFGQEKTNIVPLFILNGKEANFVSLHFINVANIDKMMVLNDAKTLKKHGTEAAGGVIEMISKYPKDFLTFRQMLKTFGIKPTTCFSKILADHTTLASTNLKSILFDKSYIKKLEITDSLGVKTLIIRTMALSSKPSLPSNEPIIRLRGLSK